MIQTTTDQAIANHDNGFEGFSPYDAIRAERDYQNRKWGGPDHDKEHSFEEWALILGREYGEVLAAMGSIVWPSLHQDSAWDRHMALRAELVQVAAVCVAIVEQMSPFPAPTPPTHRPAIIDPADPEQLRVVETTVRAWLHESARMEDIGPRILTALRDVNGGER